MFCLFTYNTKFVVRFVILCLFVNRFNTMSENSERRSSLTSLDRTLRYRELLENLTLIDDESLDTKETIKKTQEAVKEAKSLLATGEVDDRVQNPREGYLDSRVLRATSNLVMRCSFAVSGHVSNYDKHDLASHIRDFPDFWDFMFPKEVPVYSYLFGTFEPTAPEEIPRKPRARIERQQVGQLKEPQEVARLQKTEEGSEMVSRVHTFIKNKYKSTRKPISYFHLVLDPRSFSRTIENVYYVSFLARDGLISIEIDESYGLPFVKPASGNQSNEPRNLEKENQFVVSLDMEMFKEFVEAFNIQEPMMELQRL